MEAAKAQNWAVEPQEKNVCVEFRKKLFTQRILPLHNYYA
jgi:hypothetical protein